MENPRQSSLAWPRQFSVEGPCQFGKVLLVSLGRFPLCADASSGPGHGSRCFKRSEPAVITDATATARASTTATPPMTWMALPLAVLSTYYPHQKTHTSKTRVSSR
eukprot:656028-Rhodomonas_salina.1